MVKRRLKKGDQVIVITGKDKNQVGEVTKVLPAAGRVVVSGINMVSRHRKPTQENPGSKVRQEAAIHISNVAYFDAASEKRSKIGYKFEDGKKVRVIKSTDTVIA